MMSFQQWIDESAKYGGVNIIFESGMYSLVDDLEGIVNYALSIKGIKMGVLFSERDGVVKMSFRSKSGYSVKEIAEKHFEGGGHKNAAGGRSSLSLDDTVKKFRDLLPLYKDVFSDTKN